MAFPLPRSSLTYGGRLLDDELQNEHMLPYGTLSDHTLPVTDILCGIGHFPECRVLTASLDHSVKVRFFHPI